MSEKRVLKCLCCEKLFMEDERTLQGGGHVKSGGKLCGPVRPIETFGGVQVKPSEPL